MAEKSYHKTPEERVKTIEEHLKNLQSASDFLRSLANHENDCQEKTANLSLDTLYFFAGIMDMAVDTFSSELGLFRYAGKPEAFAYVRKPQAAAPEGFDLDLVTKENIFKDAKNLQDMVSQIQYIAEALCHDLGIELPPNIKEKIARQKAAQGVKAPDLSAIEPEAEPWKLNAYDPQYANAKVSLHAMWGYLEDLELVADDPAKVSAWAEMIHDELQKCEAA